VHVTTGWPPPPPPPPVFCDIPRVRPRAMNSLRRRAAPTTFCCYVPPVKRPTHLSWCAMCMYIMCVKGSICTARTTPAAEPRAIPSRPFHFSDPASQPAIPLRTAFLAVAELAAVVSSPSSCLLLARSPLPSSEKRMGRAPCCEKVGLKKGRWTKEEDEVLARYIKEHGEGSWRSLPKNAGTDRSGCDLRVCYIS
jgi:hypothetical protein